MAIQCEGCNRVNPERYDRGPFIGQPRELEYCRYCSENLCDHCMTTTTCKENPTGKHEVSQEDE